MKFSQIYLPPSELIKESKRMRQRIGAYVLLKSLECNINDFLAQKIKRENGNSVPRGVNCFSFDKFFESIQIRDVLDSLTIIFEGLREKSNKRTAKQIGEDFREFVNRVFKEEGLAYIMTEDGSIQFNPDEEFEANRILSLKCLGSSPNFQAALTAFNKAYSEFHIGAENYKSALLYIFEANEIIFKQITNSSRLSSHFIEQKTSVFLSSKLDSTSSKAFAAIINSYKSWVDAIQNYRHGQNVAEYNNPTEEFTILALSNGAAYLRWLISIAMKLP